CTYRDYHSHARGGWSLEVADEPRGCRVTAFSAARPYRVLTDRGDFQREPDWYWNFYHRAEAERGLDATEDLFRPGTFRVRLEPRDVVTLIATAESEFDPPATAFDREHKRRRSLLRATPSGAPDWIKRLTLAADQFIVRRSAPGGELRGTTVIAGYPWFSDWGRDTMIALPGLALATGRTQDAAAILRTFAAHVSEGMLPNRFPDGGEEPEYNTVDATLWYFHAVAAYLAATADQSLLRDLYPAADYETPAARVAPSFAERFWYPQGGYLYDVIDGPDGVLDIEGRRVDTSLRPNQIFAVSLGTNLLDPVRARAVVDVCAAE